MKKNICFDMDGVLAQFENSKTNWKKNFATKEGFFKKLKPYAGIEFINELAKNENVYIVSTSPTEQADNDKKEWLKIYLPDIKSENIIMVRSGNQKADILKKYFNRNLTENDILIDDYTENLTYWEKNGGTPIKRKNGINCKKGISKNMIKLARLKSIYTVLKQVA